jgi:hypothetical protein
MAVSTLSDEALCAILAAHPGLRERFVSIALTVVDSDGNLKEADAAEERIVEETRELGRAALQGWCENQVAATERDIRQQPGVRRQGKKNSTGIRNSVKSQF